LQICSWHTNSFSKHFSISNVSSFSLQLAASSLWASCGCFLRLSFRSAWRSSKRCRFWVSMKISSFPKQKCHSYTHVKFYCKIDNLVTTLIKVTCWVQYATCGIWVVGINGVKVQIMKLILFWGASVVFQQVFLFLFWWPPSFTCCFLLNFYNFGGQNKGNYYY